MIVLYDQTAKQNTKKAVSIAKNIDGCVCHGCVYAAQYNIQYPCLMQAYLTPQMEESDTDPYKNIEDTDQMVSSQQVTFDDSNAGEKMDYGFVQNPVALVDGTPDISLGKFLSHPTPIVNTSFVQTDAPGLKLSFDPWTLFMSNTAIKKKLDNFAFIRARMKVKVLLNSTPFWYGLGMLSYVPLAGMIGNPNRASTTTDACLVAASQQPHIKLVFAKSAGGELTLPFFLQKSWLKMSAAEIAKMGTCYLYTVAPPLSANASTTINISVQIVAWLEDVELMGPTVTLAAQGKDEYGDGPISAPASAVAAFASKVKVPFLNKFAKATEIGAQSISNIARLFGYSNVPVIENVHGFMPSVLPHLASSGIGTLVQKLTLDPKSELSVDPSLHGVPADDPLDLSIINGKESYFGQVGWATTDALDTQLFTARVQPIITNSVTSGGYTRLAMTPMGYMSQFFQFWRGTIIFRFKVVCSQYHKGRLRFTYDPIGRIDTNADSYNVSYTKIIDIGEDNDIEIEVPYHQATAWLEAGTLSGVNWNSGGVLPPNPQYDNGLINIRVATTLTAPVATAPVRILCYIRAGHDFEYSVPLSDSDSGGNLISLYQPQGLTAEADPLSVGPVREIMGERTNPNSNRYLMNIGESIKSFRQVIQRASTARVISLIDQPLQDWTNIFFKFGRMPIINGYDTDGVDVARNLAGSSLVPFNWVAKHPLPYVTAMFRGYRGAINHSFNFNFQGNDYHTSVDDFRILRIGSGRTSTEVGGTSVGSGTLTTRSTFDRFLNTQFAFEGTGGMAINATKTNNGVSVSLPDYNMCNFNLFAPSLITLGGIDDFSYHNTYAMSMQFVNADGSRQRFKRAAIRQLVSAGVDYTPVFFLCAPTLDVLGSQPAAT